MYSLASTFRIEPVLECILAKGVLTITDYELKDNSEEVKSAMTSALARALEKIGLVAEGYAKRLCPVDTGRLRNSITHADDGEAEYIGTNVEYAPYVELGTSRTRAQPYLKPAVVNHSDEYKKIVEAEMQDA